MAKIGPTNPILVPPNSKVSSQDPAKGADLWPGEDDQGIGRLATQRPRMPGVPPNSKVSTRDPAKGADLWPGENDQGIGRLETQRPRMPGGRPNPSWEPMKGTQRPKGRADTGQGHKGYKTACQQSWT